MQASTRLRLEQSTLNENINGRLAADSMTETERTELQTWTKRSQEVEVELRAAILVEDTDEQVVDVADLDTEQRERIELRGKAKVTNFVLAALRGKQPSGAEAEIQAAEGVIDGGIPLAMWEPTPEQRAAEQRVVAALPGTVGINLDPIMPAIFANSIAPKLGIQMPRVGSGTYATATISTSQSAAALAKSAAAVAVAGAFTVGTTGPKRVSARLELTIEDIMSIGVDNYESSLRENIALRISDELDDQMVNGNGTAPDLTGMFQRLTDPTGTAPATIAAFDDFVALFAGGIDGLWANTTKDVGVVVNPESYRLAVKTFRDRVIDTGQRGGVSLGDQSFADYGMEKYGQFWTNKRMPDKASHIAQAILYRMGRSGMGASAGMRTAVCPVWGEIGIDDIVSGSAKAERYFTMHVLLGDVILTQPDAYAQVRLRVST